MVKIGQATSKTPLGGFPLEHMETNLRNLPTCPCDSTSWAESVAGQPSTLTNGRTPATTISILHHEPTERFLEQYHHLEIVRRGWRENPTFRTCCHTPAERPLSQ